jgi:predicted PurR-regulated permease PerM
MHEPPVQELQHRTFLVMLVAVSAAFVWIIWPLFGAVFWAIVLAILFAPSQRRLVASLRGRHNLAALITLAICLVGVLLPMALVMNSLLREAAQVYADVQANRIDLGAIFQQVVAALPSWLVGLLDRLGLGNAGAMQDKLSSGAGQASRFVATQAMSIGQNTFDFFVSLAVMLYVLFFLLRDGPSLKRRVLRAIPLDAEHKERLFQTFATVIRATVKGNVVVAIAQGALGGLILWFLGIKGPFLWGVVMAVLSLLPAVGAALVWAPIAVYLMLAGAMWKGVTLIAFGVLVIGLVDNVLRPILVGKDTRMPDYLVLVSTLGGIALFGLNGFVIGPVIAAMFLAVWALVSESTAAGDG